jgi:hypothetical protein
MSAILDQPEKQQPVDDEVRLGQRLIRERWSVLAASTRELLMKSGYYGPRGNRLEPEDPPPSWVPETDAERLEWALGTFKRCLAAKLPTRKERGAPVPSEALTDDVLNSCDSLLMVPQWHDPEFLRYGLSAVAVHQEANALAMASPEKAPAVAELLLRGLGGTALMLLAPYGLASGLAAAMRQDVWSAVGGFFLLGVGVVAARERAIENAEKAPKAPRAEDNVAKHFEYAYKAWQRFRYFHMGVTGSSAKFHLERLASEGILVPAVALDLCEALRARVQSVAAGC